MARQGKGILGAPSKSIGMITAQKHSGKDTIRSKPKPSIKTQTPKLLKTKSDFELALHIYNEIKNSNAAHLFDGSIKNNTAKNHFIGSIIKLLNIKKDKTFILSLFPKSIPYDKMQPYLSTPGNRRNWGFKQNLQPLHPLAKPDDIRCRILFDEASNYLFVSVDGSSGTRGTTQFLNNWNVPVYPSGHRRIYIIFFRSALDNRVFNAYASAGAGI